MHVVLQMVLLKIFWCAVEIMSNFPDLGVLKIELLETILGA